MAMVGALFDMVATGVGGWTFTGVFRDGRGGCGSSGKNGFYGGVADY